MPEPQDTQYGRPLLIEERTNRYIIHPLSAIVEKFAIRWGVSANIVSFLGLGCGLLAGLLYYYQDYRLYVLGGFLFMCLWHVFDGADGRIARATGTSSAFGRIIDGMCDHIVFGAVYFAFVFFALKNGASPWVWGLGILAALSHGLQSAGYEERRQKYQRRMKGTNRDQVNASLLNVKGKSSFIAQIYDKIQKVVSGGESPLDSALEAHRSSPSAKKTTTDLVKSTARIVKAWSLLNANNRTIMIAVFALLGQPVLYFIYEIVVLNTILVGLIIYERLAERRIASHTLSELSAS